MILVPIESAYATSY